MKLFGVKFSLDAAKLTFAVVKLSGYIFYTIQIVDEHTYSFKRTLLDAAFFVVSIVFSILAYFYVGAKEFEKDVKSAILSKGVNFLFKLLLIAIIYTKCFGLVMASKSFEIITSLRWIELKVT